MNRFWTYSAHLWCDTFNSSALQIKHVVHHTILRAHWLLLVVVFLCTLLGQTWAVRAQSHVLTHQQHQLLYDATLAAHERELRHAVSLAKTVINRLAHQNAPTTTLQQQALAILSQMQLGQNGYFFVYDAQGRSLLEPEQMRLQGVDFCEPDSVNGTIQARQLLLTAQTGGGLVRYNWQRPSNQDFSRKVSYIEALGHWGWSIGTGIYEDDILANIEDIKNTAHTSVDRFFKTNLWIGLFFILFLSTITYGVHYYLFSQFRKKIQHLGSAILQSETQARQHMARDLHDGALQIMASAKYLLESAQHVPKSSSHQLVTRALGLLGQALQDIRQMAHNPRPQALAQGLHSALHALMEHAQSCNITTHSALSPATNKLPQDIQIALYFIAQEAISNAMTHSGCNRLHLTLQHNNTHELHLQVRDNGAGMRDNSQPSQSDHGMGLHNIRARAAQLRGHCTWCSTAQGTTLDVYLPWSAH